MAEEKYLRDVPDGHYAYDAVYDLIQRGVTTGYPDGTFRGNNNLSRYEIAAFIANLNKSFNRRQGANGKLAAELQSEVALSEYERQAAQQETQVSGGLTSRWRGAEAGGQRGAAADYRLQTTVVRNVGDNASLKIGLDTMDAGFNNAGRDLARDLLDFEGQVKFGTATLRITDGPGDVAPVAAALFPAENGLLYRRPRRTASFSNVLGQTEFTLEHLTRSDDPSGLIGVEEISLRLAQNLNAFRLTLNPRYFTGVSGRRDNRLDLGVEYNAAKAWRSSLLVGIAKTSDYPHGLYLRGELAWADQVKLLLQKIGGEYRETFSYSIFDLFDRALADGALNYGVELSLPADQPWIVSARTDYTDPGAVLTTEFSFGRRLDQASALLLVYQYYRANSEAQALGLQANLRF